MNPLKKILFLFLLALSRLKAECPIGTPDECKCTKELGLYHISCKDVNKLSSLQDIFIYASNSTVDQMSIFCSKSLKELPIFPKMHVKRLEISNCGIEEFYGKILNSMSEHLETLKLVNNSLKSIPIFDTLLKLEALNLNGNQITEIPEHIFDSLKRIRVLRLRNNKICALSRNALSETKSILELLDLSENCLTSVPAQSVRSAMKLVHLDLSHNNISEIGPMSFMNLPALKELKIDSNNLTKVAPNAFMNVPQLRILSLKENLLTKMDSSTLHGFKQLEMLDLGKNFLNKIPSFKEMTHLKQVRLDYNNFSSIETLTFSSNTNLEIIDLQNNKISIIARNSFDTLDRLTTLLLANNSLPKLERSMLDGLPNLQHLDLHNNSISYLSNTFLASLPRLAVLDISSNGLKNIDVGAFSKQKSLYWLDLSNNRLETFEKGVFGNKIANILLDGNPLVCDSKMDDFLFYLVMNQVRTFLPYQSEIKCAGPKKFAGVRLKELMIKKTNESLPLLMPKLGRKNQKQENILESLFPGLANLGIMQSLGTQPNSDLTQNPIVNSLAQAISPLQRPSPANPLANNPRLVLNQANGQILSINDQNVDNQQIPANLGQVIQNLPSMIVNIPGLGNVDISKLPPQLIEHVLRGGQLPGVPKEVLDSILKQYIAKIRSITAQNGQLLLTSTNYPINPRYEYSAPQYATNVVEENGKLTLKTHPIKTPINIPTDETNYAFGNITSNFQISPHLIQLMKLIPPGYNLSNLPKEVTQKIMRGETPDLALLPVEILEYIRDHSEELFQTFTAMPNIKLEDLLKKLPKFEHPDRSTFSPYDINKVDAGGIVLDPEAAERQFRTRILAALLLGFVGIVTIIILILFCIYVRRNHLHTVQEIPSINSITPLTDESKSRRASTISSHASRIERSVQNPIYSQGSSIYGGSNTVSLYRI